MATNLSTMDLGGRHHFLDWVRVLAFAMLIFYHTGMMFVSWEFHVESGYDSELLKSVMMLTSSWRLDILFIVSGVAISFMVSKMPLRFFTRQRVIKLLVPLLFAVAVVIVPQAYYEALQKGVYEGSFWQFWTQEYFTFVWDERMLAPFPTYNHMWYVLYLFAYTLILLPLFTYINGASGRRRLAVWETWLAKGTRVLWCPLALHVLILLAFRSDEISHAFYNDWYGHSIYLLALLLGLLFVRMPGVWLALERNRSTSLVLALVGYAVLLADHHLPESAIPYSGPEVGAVVKLVVKWSWIAMILGYARRYLNFSNAVLTYCGQVVYPFFILHQTVIIVIGYYVIEWPVSGAVAYLLIVASTFLCCGVLYEGLIRRVNVLRLMFGMKWQQGRLFYKSAVTI